jgi:hypothetical protein
MRRADFRKVEDAPKGRFERVQIGNGPIDAEVQDVKFRMSSRSL